MVFNVIINIIPVIEWRPVPPSMLSKSSSLQAHRTIFFPSLRLLSKINTVHTIESGEKGMDIISFYMPVEDGTYHVITRGGRAGGVLHYLSGAYLQYYASNGYEISWVDRSYQGRVQCAGTITLA